MALANVGSGPFLGWIIKWAFAHQKLKPKKKKGRLAAQALCTKKKVRACGAEKERKSREREKERGVRV